MKAAAFLPVSTLGHIAARLGLRSVHEVEPQDCFLAQDLGVEAVAVIALVLHEAATLEDFPFVSADDGRQREERDEKPSWMQWRALVHLPTYRLLFAHHSAPAPVMRSRA